MPTCAGFDATKTLAKLANHVIKLAERKPGSYPVGYSQMFSFNSIIPAEQASVFEATAFGKVCGRRISAK